MYVEPTPTLVLLWPDSEERNLVRRFPAEHGLLSLVRLADDSLHLYLGRLADR